jgi:hypothetical protein
MTRRLLMVIAGAYAALLVTSLPASAQACVGIPILEHSTVSTQGGVLLACPDNDGARLEDIGSTIFITVRSKCPEWPEPLPIPGIPATDIWLWSDGLVLCGGSGSSNADGPTDANGQTTISGAVASGGYASGTIQVVVTGILIGELPTLTIVSPDINGDLQIDLVDLAAFAVSYTGAYDPRADMDGDGSLDLRDFSLFAAHWLHVCN